MTRARNLSRLSNNNILSVDSTNQRVGVGTSTPNFPLHVVGVGSTALFVDGGARITGILSVGQGTVTIDGNNSTIKVQNIVVTESIKTQEGGGGIGYVTETYVNNALSTKISGVGIQSSGVFVGSGITTFNFAGAGNTFSISGSTATITISSGTNGIGVQSEGSTVGTGVTTLNFLGVANTFSYNQSTQVMSIGIPRSLTVGVRTGSSVNFLIQSGSFNVLSRSGQSIIINTAT